MYKKELEKLVAELQEQLKYIREENTRLKNELALSRKNYLEVIEKWNETADKLRAL